MKIFRILLALVLVYAIYTFFFSGWNSFNFKGLIPENIEVTKAIETSGDGLCGVAIFDLSKSTIDNIKKSSLNAFTESKHGRDHHDDHERLYDYYTYSSWKETPYPVPRDELVLEKIWPSVCSSSDRSMRKKIEGSLNVTGSYYATFREGGLIIIPNLGLAVVTHLND